MKNLILVLMLAITCCTHVHAQVKIGDNPGNISPGSLLELESTSRAFTLPRMTTLQMEAIPSPERGMMLFNTDSNCIYLYKSGNAWVSILAGAPQPSWPYQSNDGSVGTPGNKKGIISLTGTNLAAIGDYSHAEGNQSVASGDYALSIGNRDTASGLASIALGVDNKATGSYSLAAGYKNIAAYESSVALGQENSDSGWASLAMGLRNRIGNTIYYSTALGYNNQVNAGWSHTVMGEGNITSGGRANFSSGLVNNANGTANSLLGNGNTSLDGVNNLLAGQNNLVQSGIANTLLGANNTADANFSAAIGTNNSTYYQSAVALGQGNKDSGWASVTGGLSNVIEKNVQYSASFGTANITRINTRLAPGAGGTSSFSAGKGNLNTGYASMALGRDNLSTNYYSLASNHATISNGYAMSAFGHYNDTLPAYPGLSFQAQEMLFAIGNGTNNENRRNSFTMLRNGFTSINTTEETGASIPRAELDIKGTGAIIVPVGSSAERPPAPVEGMIRFCNDCGPAGTGVLQGYNGITWVNL